MLRDKPNLAEIKSYLKNELLGVIEERARNAAALAAKTAITFLGTAIGIFLRELVQSPNFKQMVEGRKEDEIEAAVRTALQELWGRTYDIFFNTFRQGIGTSLLEANFFAERVMSIVRNNENKKEEPATEEKLNEEVELPGNPDTFPYSPVLR